MSFRKEVAEAIDTVACDLKVGNLYTSKHILDGVEDLLGVRRELIQPYVSQYFRSKDNKHFKVESRGLFRKVNESETGYIEQPTIKSKYVMVKEVYDEYIVDLEIGKQIKLANVRLDLADIIKKQNFIDCIGIHSYVRTIMREDKTLKYLYAGTYEKISKSPKPKKVPKKLKVKV